jgi:hypothetical protein
MILFENWGEDGKTYWLPQKKCNKKLHPVNFSNCNYATFNILILLLLNLRCAYSSVTSKVFTF